MAATRTALLLAALTLGGLAAATHDRMEVENGDFETDADGDHVPDGWTVVHGLALQVVGSDRPGVGTAGDTFALGLINTPTEGPVLVRSPVIRAPAGSEGWVTAAVEQQTGPLAVRVAMLGASDLVLAALEDNGLSARGVGLRFALPYGATGFRVEFETGRTAADYAEIDRVRGQELTGSDVNLLTNGAFVHDADGDAMPDLWSAQGCTEGETRLDPAGVNGPWSLLVRGSATPCTVSSLPFPAVQQTTYRFQFLVHQDEAPGRAEILWFDDQHRPLGTFRHDEPVSQPNWWMGRSVIACAPPGVAYGVAAVGSIPEVPSAGYWDLLWVHPEAQPC